MINTDKYIKHEIFSMVKNLFTHTKNNSKRPFQNIAREKKSLNNITTNRIEIFPGPFSAINLIL